MKIELGSTVKDKISGFTGVVVGRTEYLYGCVRLEVAANILDGVKPLDFYCFDEPQLEAISGPDGNLTGVKKKVATHGPRPNMERRSDFIKNNKETKRR